MSGTDGASNLAALISHAPQLSVTIPSRDWARLKLALFNTSQKKYIILTLNTKKGFLYGSSVK